ncbi:MAG: aminotransferase DegT [Bacteroidetes bacterium GWF2_40_14]|nr:MAG: aminotransferase DegT [Bacteroidetes bacterium GWF2_40_14]
MESKFSQIIEFIREKYKTPEGIIPLHEPRFNGNEKKYLHECIDTTFVSSVGKFVTRFEEMVAEFTGAKHAIAAVNGTAALHISLLLCDVKPDDEVITQALTFVATANSIAYTGAKPVFVDVDRDTMGLSPISLKSFLTENTTFKNGLCINNTSGKRIKACVPMHTFGHPCRIDEIISICNQYNIDVVEDAAESLGSYFKGQHTGTFGKFGTLSFNGNKTITTGGGGMILTKDDELGKLAKHITTTAKVPHRWEFVHDMTAYNYRLTNLASALGCAQMEQLPNFIVQKRKLAEAYSKFFKKLEIEFITEAQNSSSNYWLNTIILKDKAEQSSFLEFMNNNNIMVRPVWQLMNRLEMYKDCQCGSLENTEWLTDRVVNLPSSVVINL